MSLFTQVYKWLLAIRMLGGNLVLNYKHPIQGGVAIFLVTSNCLYSHSFITFSYFVLFGCRTQFSLNVRWCVKTLKGHM